MIYFEVWLDKYTLLDIFIFLNNQVLIIKDLAIINKQFIKNQVFDRIVKLKKLILLFILLLPRLILKYNNI